MKQRRLGRTGIYVGEIGMGCEHLLNKDGQVVIDTIKAAFDGGVNYLDCHPSDDYKPEMEDYAGFQKLGAAIKGIRDELALSHIAPAVTPSVEVAERKFQNYLKALGTDHTDVYMIQFCDKQLEYDSITGEKGLLGYAKRLVEEGTARFIGISTHSRSVAHQAVASGDFDVIMYPVNPAFDVITDGTVYDTDNIETLWDAAAEFETADKTGAQPRRSVYAECVRHDIGIIAMKPFAGGFIFRFAKDAGFTPVNLISYALSQHGVSTVVPGCTKPDEIREILGYYGAANEERDYSGAVARSKWSVTENCLYCNHCLPCGADINIGMVNRLLDSVLLETDPDMARVRAEYGKLGVKASACVNCGVCVERCPFRVKVIDRMKQAADMFE